MNTGTSFSGLSIRRQRSMTSQEKIRQTTNNAAPNFFDTKSQRIGTQLYQVSRQVTKGVSNREPVLVLVLQ